MRHKEDQVFLLQYILDVDEEVTWISASDDAQIFYNSNFDFMLADPQMGIVNLETKEVLHEYHVKQRQAEELKGQNMSWG